MTNANTSRAMMAVAAERVRQDEKWGVQDHHAHTWSAILSEECGEFAQASLHDDVDALRKEAVQVAAVALAIVEWIDRGGTVTPFVAER